MTRPGSFSSVCGACPSAQGSNRSARGKATGSGTVIEVEVPITGPADRNREPDDLLAQATTSGSSG
jgi:hypothetical protein